MQSLLCVETSTATQDTIKQAGFQPDRLLLMAVTTPHSFIG